MRVRVIPMVAGMKEPLRIPFNVENTTCTTHEGHVVEREWGAAATWPRGPCARAGGTERAAHLERERGESFSLYGHG